MNKWQYKFYVPEKSFLENPSQRETKILNELNCLGLDGWELVTYDPNYTRYILKKEQK